MRSFPAFFRSTLTLPLGLVLGLGMPCVVAPVHAQQIAYEPVDLDMGYGVDRAVYGGGRMQRFDPAPSAQRTLTPVALSGHEAAYGPFRVIDETRAALVDVTGARSPAQFRAMLRDHPGIAVIEMIECPGTEDDLANLEVGRMIRERGIVTHVPDGGSVRSGGVELFLAGARRIADPGSEFAVHSWIDEDGREPGDYAASAPENRRYLEYYRQMGMSPIEAEAFYTMTNSVPFESARWFGAGVMSLWVPLETSEDPDVS